MLDLTGQVFGRLTVVCKAGHTDNNITLWACRCFCGKSTIIVTGPALRSGHIESCGCVVPFYRKHKRYVRGGRIRNFTHNMSYHPLYTTWAGMKQRCSNTNNAAYKYYGGRGITVCNDWANSFPQFLYDMGEKPAPEYSIDRINVNGNYEPSNCRWATPKQQANNQRKREF